MQLYAIHQPEGDFDTQYWDAIWANSPSEAVAFYSQRWKGECDPSATNEEFAEGLHWEQVEASEPPVKDGVHSERRDNVLRRLGWHVESERSCDTCGLYPMDMDEYAVCPDCNQCTECGCDCEPEPSQEQP